MIPYDTDDDAIRIANDSEYGLHGGVFTTSPERALDVARRVRTGTFTVNGYMVNFDAPFGGVRSSGLGREFAVEGLLSYTEQKTVNFPHGVAAPPAHRLTRLSLLSLRLFLRTYRTASIIEVPSVFLTALRRTARRMTDTQGRRRRCRDRRGFCANPPQFQQGEAWRAS